MRTQTAAEVVLAALVSGRTARIRVKVKDASGTFQDLSTFPGFNASLSANWKEDVDSVGMSATIKLKRAMARRSLNPFFTASGLNHNWDPANAYGALLNPGREVQVERALAAAGEVGTTWVLAFHGYVDKVSIEPETISLECRGLEARLMDTFIEREKVWSYAQGAGATKGCYVFDSSVAYATNDLVIPTEAKINGHYYKVTTPGTSAAEPTWPTGGGSTVSSGGVTFTETGAGSATTGTALETVLQTLLDDVLGAGVVTLRTPVSPAWNLKWWLQKRTSLWEAMRTLVDQIGWDLRYAWDSGSSTFKLTLQQPPRGKSSADYGFSARYLKSVDALAIDITAIRNVVQVVYSDSTALDYAGAPLRKTVLVSDSASITKFGRRWMELGEASSSNIDSSTEATAMATAALNDLSTPSADFATTVFLFPWAELGDLYAFAPPAAGLDGDVLFDSVQTLGVVGVEHNVDDKTATTKLTLRGKPSGGYMRWLGRDAATVWQDESHQLALAGGGAGLSVTATPVVGGTALLVAQQLGKHALARGYEIHISSTPSFTPSAATLKAVAQGQQTVIPDLVPGQTYYAQALPFGFNAARKVRGQSSAEFSFVAARAQACHYDSVVSQGHWPLNGNFEHAFADLTTTPPDHWRMTNGSWGSGSDAYFGTDATYGRFLSLRQTGGDPNVRSSPWPIRRGMGHANVYLSVRQQGTASAGRDLMLYFRFYSLADLSDTPTLYTFTIPNGLAAINTWATYVIDSNFFNVVPGQANFCTLTFGKGAISSAYGWDIGDVFFTEGQFEALYVNKLYPTTIDVPAWVAPTMVNNWVNTALGYLNAGYCKDPMGFIHLRGEIKRNTGVGVDGEVIFNMPAGFRPSAKALFPVASNVTGGYVEVSTGGDLLWRSSAGQNWLHLDGITFDTR